jgi:hypothetical protein
VWNTRTGGITDANFPFGFVQVRKKFTWDRDKVLFCSYRQAREPVMSSEVFHGFGGIKPLMLAMCLTMWYPMYSWQRRWICVMILEGMFKCILFGKILDLILK